MKKAMIVILVLVAIGIGGCIGNTLKREVFDRETGKLISRLEITNLKSMVNTQTKSLAMNVSDVNFTARLLIIDSNVVASPESATAIGNAITNVMTGGASGVLNKAIK
jgi:outer membrane lipoprotein SlyB